MRETKNQLALAGGDGFFFFCADFLKGLGGMAPFGTDRIVFIALRKRSNALRAFYHLRMGFMAFIIARLRAR